jgi:Carboxypeptidase regulatory-like domain/TonB dependent receptor
MGRNLRLLAALLGTLALQIASAQTQSINGSIRGRVTDAAGSAVPQAKVEVANAENGYTRAYDTPDDGYFVFPNLPLGTYTVTIQKAGFEARRNTGVVIDAGTEAVINAALTVGSVTTSIEVSGGAPVLEVSRLNTGRTIEHREVDNLPLTSRNPYNFINFQPGVSGHPNAELGIPRTINTNGLLDRINYQMDGMVNTESDRYGLRLFPISDIYVREVQTVSNSFAPEFGGTAGNIFNVITNSGANAYHAEFYYIGRPVDANARPILLAANKPKPDLTLSDIAVNGSGRIIKDKLFFFMGYEHLNRGLPQPITIDQNSAALIGIPSNLLGTAPSVQHAQFLNIRLDYNITSKHQAFIRYNYFRNEYPYNTAVGGLNALDVAADFRDRAHVLGAQLLSTFSPTMLNELRGSWPYRNEAHNANPTTTGPGPQVVITNVATFGGSSAIGDKFAEKIPSLADNFTLIRGTHTFKLGAGFQKILDNQVGNVYSRYTFSSIANYLLAKNGTDPKAYNTFTTILGVPGTHYNSFFWNFFVQDSWQLRPNLLVMYGLRYDKFKGPDGEPNAPFSYTQNFRTPGANFAPRLGLAYSINPKTVLRLNAGMFYEAPPTNLWYNAFANDGSARSFQTSFGPTAAGAPAYPAVFNFVPGATPTTPSITAVTPNFKNAYTTNLNFQVQRQLSTNDALTVGYVHTAARNMEYLRNLNLINPTSFLADGRPVYSAAINATTRLYPQFANITLADIGAISNYDALVTSFTHRWSQGYSVTANYTWSHSISDAPDVNSFEQNAATEDPTNRTRDRGNSIVNRPSAFTLTSVVQPTFKFDNKFWNTLANNNQLTFLARASSGDQINYTANRVLNGDTIATSRPLYLGRNTGRGSNIYQFDSRYTRTFFTWKEHLQPKFFVEVSNLLNHKNITTYSSTITVDANGAGTVPSTLTPLSTVLEGRILQLGVRVDW